MRDREELGALRQEMRENPAFEISVAVRAAELAHDPNWTVTVTDMARREIKVGSRVHYYDELPSTSESDSNVGEVIEITEFEGDVDDDTGRSRTIAPEVRVRYWTYNGTRPYVEVYPTNEWTYDYSYEATEDGPMPSSCAAVGICEELTVLED